MAAVETITQLFEAATARLATYQPETLVALALDQRTDYRQAQLQRQRQALDLLLAEDNLRWQLNAVANGLLGDSNSSVVGLVATRTFGDPSPKPLESPVTLPYSNKTTL
ncbi:MAG: hypothetical protein AAFW95_15115 [Cyanobacteria bacterium J06638_6]